MRKLPTILKTITLVFIITSISTAQISNFTVNGLETGAQARQGAIINWQYDLSIGGTATIEIWVDRDSNKTANPTFDFQLFVFPQEDGGEASDGPPDMDEAINGQVSVQLPNGLAVAHYVMIASENGVTDTVDFKILPLENPKYSIFGKVMEEDGTGIPWISVGAFTEDEQVMPDFWDAITDSLGNFIINMDSTAGLSENPWKVELENSTLGGFVVKDQDTSIVVSGNHGPINFIVSKAQMYISGVILDHTGTPIQERFHAWARNDSLQKNRDADVNPDGSFTIGFADTDFGEWSVGIWSPSFGQTLMEPNSKRLTLVSIGDSLTTNFTVYTADEMIYGKLVADGDSIVANRQIYAESNQIGRTQTTTDDSGNFQLMVSSVVNQYEIHLEWNDYDHFMQSGFTAKSSYPAIGVPGDSVLMEFTKNQNQFGELSINGQNTGAQTRQGESLSWQYNLSQGGTARVEVWFDKDGNRVFESQFDFRLVEFYQTDNGQSQDGPSDMDGFTNGQIRTEFKHGLGVGYYFLQVSENQNIVFTDFEVLPVLNPPYSVFGQVVDKGGNGIPWAVVEMHIDDNQVRPDFWMAFTDNQGNFTFQLDSSVGQTLTQWEVKPDHQFLNGKNFSPSDTSISVTGNHGPIVFREISTEVVVYGSVFNQDGSPFQNQFDVWARNQNSQNHRYGIVHPNGSYDFIFYQQDFGPWEIGLESNNWNGFLEPSPKQMEVTSFGDSLTLDFYVYSVDDTIWGQFLANGDPIVGNKKVSAKNDTTGNSFGETDGGGYFTLPVSNDANGYKIEIDPGDYNQIVQAGFYLTSAYPVFASPGDTVKFEFSSDPVQFGNLLVNDVSTGAQAQQGELVTWQFNIPIGETANNEIWIDRDGNKKIDSQVDFALYMFTQTDNEGENNGPPDMDGIANGQVWVQMKLGLAPAKYLMRINYNNLSDTSDFEITPLVNPKYSIFGQVFDENGVGARWILVEADAESNQDMPNFWHAITDSSGNFVINMDSTAGFVQGSWKLDLGESTLNGLLAEENEYVIQLSGNHGPYEFHLSKPKVYVIGQVLDHNGNPLQDYFDVYAWNDSLDIHRGSHNVDSLGNYHIGFTENDYGHWEVGVWSDQMEGKYLHPQGKRMHLTSQDDTLYAIFTLYQIDDYIWGKIVADGDPIVGNKKVFAENDTTGRSETYTDSEGNFRIPVSQFAQNYRLNVERDDYNHFMNAGYHMVNSQDIAAAPGDTTTIVFTKFSDVEKVDNSNPTTFSLQQNYPNPLHIRSAQPTTINFQVPKTSHVTIAIYNLLGQEIYRLIDLEMQPGNHQLNWFGKDQNGFRISNGLYFIRMTAPNFTQLRKLMIVN